VTSAAGASVLVLSVLVAARFVRARVLVAVVVDGLCMAAR